jgi:hypothetical protein
LSTVATSNGHISTSSTDGEFMDLLDRMESYDFIWPTLEDTSVARQAGLYCMAADATDLTRYTRGRKVIVAGYDTEDGRREAQELAEDCVSYKAASRN